MQISERGKDLIKSYEGLSLTAVRLEGETYWTIGWGHYGPDVYEGMTITLEQANTLFDSDIVYFEDKVNEIAVQKFPSINQNQFDALCSYTYNRGAGGLIELVTNSTDVINLGLNFVVYWGTNIHYKEALIARRRKEQELYFDGDIPPTPTKRKGLPIYMMIRRI